MSLISKISLLILISLLSFEFVDSGRFSPIELDEDSYISIGIDDADDAYNTLDGLVNDLIFCHSFSIHFLSTDPTSQDLDQAVCIEFFQIKELYIWFKQLRIFHLKFI